MLIYLRGIIYAIIPRIGKFFARPVSGQFGFTGARVVASGKNKKPPERIASFRRPILNHPVSGKLFPGDGAVKL
jgi:hypothetical protein